MPTTPGYTSAHMSFVFLRAEGLGTSMATEIAEEASGDNVSRLVFSAVSAGQ